MLWSRNGGKEGDVLGECRCVGGRGETHCKGMGWALSASVIFSPDTLQNKTKMDFCH
jgi:hypothetical protein